MAARHPRLPSLLAALATLGVMVFGVGFLLHTDFEPAVFGKYGGGYFAFLLAWWLVLTPLTFFFVQFVLRTQRIELSAGTAWHVRPSLKILLCILLYWGAASIVEHQIHKRSGEGVATPMRSDEFHPYLQNVMRPSRTRFETNRWGYRGVEIEKPKPVGVFRIFCLGGSTTASVPLKSAQTYPEQLAARLRKAHPEVIFEIQNAGGEWHTTQHSLFKLLTDIRSFDPDLILCYHAINDLCRSLTPDLFSHGTYRADYRHYFGPVAGLARPEESRWPIVRMRLGYCFSDLSMHRVRIVGPEGAGVRGMTMAFLPKAEEVDVEHWQSLGAFRRNLTDLCSICREAKIDLILASQPFLYRPDLTAHEQSLLWTPISHQWDGKRPSLAAMIRGMERFNAATAEIAKVRGVGFVDLEAVVPKTLEYLYDDVHYTAKACDVIAGAFFDHLRSEGTVKARLRRRAAR
jgi:hypothetical protein